MFGIKAIKKQMESKELRLSESVKIYSFSERIPDHSERLIVIFKKGYSHSYECSYCRATVIYPFKECKPNEKIYREDYFYIDLETGGKIDDLDECRYLLRKDLENSFPSKTVENA